MNQAVLVNVVLEIVWGAQAQYSACGLRSDRDRLEFTL